jgi:hypothetical protein
MTFDLLRVSKKNSGNECIVETAYSMLRTHRHFLRQSQPSSIHVANQPPT